MKHHKRFGQLLASLLIIISNNSFAIAQQTDTSKSELLVFKLINQRLSYMKDIALYKYLNNKAIEDRRREKTIINNALATAEAHALNPNTIRDFFNMQIAAAKAIQYRYSADWQFHQPNPTTPVEHLLSKIRPKLTKLGNEIILIISACLKGKKSFNNKDKNAFLDYLTVSHITQQEKLELFKSLQNIKLKQ